MYRAFTYNGQAVEVETLEKSSRLYINGELYNIYNTTNMKSIYMVLDKLFFRKQGKYYG